MGRIGVTQAGCEAQIRPLDDGKDNSRTVSNPVKPEIPPGLARLGGSNDQEQVRQEDSHLFD